MTPVAWGILLILGAGLAAAAAARRPAAADLAWKLFFAGGCVSGMVSAVRVLAGAPATEFRLPSAVPGGPWVFGLDVLSAVFLFAILAVGAAAALYGASYLAAERGRRPVAVAHLLLSLLVASMTVLVLARSVVPFLIAWEGMALSAGFLILFERERAPVRRAGLLYLVAAHTSTLALYALFVVWAGPAGDLTFAALAARAPLAGSTAVWLMLLALFGFGLKAGLVPLHFWLPAAHAAAPSHVSALMSGVVIKMGIYGLLRVIALSGAPPAWLGWLLLLLGVTSGILGVVWALAQHDLKRLLAFHSVENIGIILMGMGAGVLGVATGHPAVAVIGFAGAALHSVNHALFKSLLFLAAGSVIHAVHTRDIDRLGGLARVMPVTATTFLVGSAAIVGLPPLNGFLSEWLVARALLGHGITGDAGRLAVLALVALGLIGALALACFAKVFGVVFLGRPRDPAVDGAHESPAGMTGPLAALAAACALIGLLPVFALPPVLRAGALLAGTTDPALVEPGPAAGMLSLLGAALVAGTVVTYALVAGIRRRLGTVRAPTWGCGYDSPTPRMQYTSSSFAAPVLLAFRSVAGVRVTRTAQSYATHAIDPVMDGIVLRGWHAVRSLAGRVRPMQKGRLSLYLLYIVITLVVLLVYLLFARDS